MTRALTVKQLSFAEEYLVDRSATQAAIRAGYSEKTARTQGSLLLTNVDIQNLIEVGMNARSIRTNIEADEVLEFWAAGMRGHIKEITLTLNEEGQPQEKCQVIKIADRLKASEMVARHLGMFEKDNHRQVDLDVYAKMSEDELLEHISANKLSLAIL